MAHTVHSSNPTLTKETSLPTPNPESWSKVALMLSATGPRIPFSWKERHTHNAEETAHAPLPKSPRIKGIHEYVPRSDTTALNTESSSRDSPHSSSCKESPHISLRARHLCFQVRHSAGAGSSLTRARGLCCHIPTVSPLLRGQSWAALGSTPESGVAFALLSLSSSCGAGERKGLRSC